MKRRRIDRAEIEEAARKILADPKGAPTLGGLAEKLQVSPAALCRRYRQVRGRTLGEEITRARIERAKELLRSNGENLAQIAEATGYGTLRQFLHQFRQREGLTPTEYRTAAIMRAARDAQAKEASQ